MADEQPPSQLSQESRQFLQNVLEDCRHAETTRDGELIRIIEDVLAGKRPPHEPAA